VGWKGFMIPGKPLLPRALSLKRPERTGYVIPRPPIAVEGRLDRGIQVKNLDCPVKPDNDEIRCYGTNGSFSADTRSSHVALDKGYVYLRNALYYDGTFNFWFNENHVVAFNPVKLETDFFKDAFQLFPVNGRQAWQWQSPLVWK